MVLGRRHKGRRSGIGPIENFELDSDVVSLYLVGELTNHNFTGKRKVSRNVRSEKGVRLKTR